MEYATDDKKILLDHIRLLEAKKCFHQSERDGLKSVLKKDISGVAKKTKMVKVLFTIEGQNVGVVFQVLSDIPKLCANETMKRELFSTMSSRRWVCPIDVVQNLGVEAAFGIFVALYADDTLTFVEIFFTHSFQIEQKFPSLEIVEKLKDKAE